MSPSHPSLSAKEQHEARLHLERVLSSRTLEQAERLRRFLEYIARHTLAGKEDRLNQYAIAIDVFDRDESFDPTIDAIVRVEAGRLRSKLLAYYDDEGRNDRLRLSLAKRGYRVDFTPASAPESEPPELRRPEQKPVSLGGVELTDPTLAVLPFENMSSDPEQTYFSDGMTEDLITDLSGLAGLAVIAGQSTFAYEGKPADAKAVSRALGADFIVKGSVRRNGDRLRVNAQLVHGQTGTHFWAERFDRDVQDLFELQDSINQKIVDALRAQLSTVRQTQQRRRGSSELEAYDYLLRGMSEFQKRTQEGSARARYCFETALTLDPDYSDAYARLCFSAIYDWIAGWNNDFEETVERGLEYAHRACEIDRDNAFAYAALCWARLWRGEHDLAATAGEKALELDANHVAALEYRALALAWGGRAEQGLKCIAKAQFLNPLHGYHFPLAVCNFSLGRYDAAAEAAQHSVNASPRFIPAHLYLAASLQLLGRRSELRPVVARIRELDPNYVAAQTRPTTFKNASDRARFVNALETAMGKTSFE